MSGSLPPWREPSQGTGAQFWPSTSNFVMRSQKQEGMEGVPSQGHGGCSTAELPITRRGGTVPAL